MQIEKASAAVRQSLNRKMRKMDSTEEQGVSHDHHHEALEECKIDKHRLRTVTLINLAGMMERMDEQASQQLPPLHHAGVWCTPDSSAHVLQKQSSFASVSCLLLRSCQLSIMPWARHLMRPQRHWATSRSQGRWSRHLHHLLGALQVRVNATQAKPDLTPCT